MKPRPQAPTPAPLEAAGTPERVRGMGRVVIVPAAGVLLALLALLGAGVWWRLSVEAERVEATRATITAQSLAASDDLQLAVSPGDAQALAASARMIGQAMERDPRLVYVSVSAVNGATLFSRFRRDTEGRSVEADWGIFDGAQKSLATGEARAVPSTDVELVVAEADVAFSGILSGEVQAVPRRGAPIARLYVGMSLASEGATRTRLLASLLAAGLVALALYTAAMAVVLRRLSRRMQRVAERARAVQAGDLTARVGDETPDELGAVARAFDQATRRQARVVERISAVTSALESTAQRIAGAAESVRRGAAQQRREVDGSARVADEVANALQEIARRAEAAHGEARSGASATARISVGAEAVSRGVDQAQGAVAEGAEGVLAIARSIREVAERAEEVAAAASSTSNAIVELTATIQRVRETAEASARLAEHAGGDAERGQKSLAETLEGIDRIRIASRAIGDATAGMERRAGEIGAVLELVSDLTERTNLLALNASIIAAQAGVEGRGFAVVAVEIKDLARRTATSAGEIADLVRGVSDEAAEARRAALAGSAAVEDGAERAAASATALAGIFARVRESAQLSLSIATSTDEQVRASRYVSDAMEKVTTAVSEIARATAEQTHQGDQLGELSERLRQLVLGVGDATREQRDGLRQVAASVEALQGTVERVAAAQHARAGDGARMRSALGTIRQVAAGHEGAVAALDAAVEELQANAHALAGELDRIRT